MAYLPIESYGLIGDMHSAALVGMNGSIDWCCLPYFDSPSVFAGLLDEKIGGYFRVAPEIVQKQRQMYLPDTNILLTRFYTAGGLGEVEDFMPIVSENGSGESKIHQIIRSLKCIRGEVEFLVRCEPAFDYGRKALRVRKHAEGYLFEVEGPFNFALRCPSDLEVEGQAIFGRIRLREGETASLTFALLPTELGENVFAKLRPPEVEFEETRRFWQRWIARCTYQGRWSDMIYRSALTLKLLTFQPTGAIVAAPTMGLPEFVGGTRNWDYRYTWIRDASFTIYALMRIGYREEATAFLTWLEARCDEMNTVQRGKFNPFAWFSSRAEDTLSPEVPPLNLMYGVRGEHVLPEVELDHLSGYRNSRPVRMGNAAYSQRQLDIYGEFIDAVFVYHRHVQPISAKLWSNIRQLVEWVCANWDKEDEGIWEWRAGKQKFVFSRLMCWVALDRAVRFSLNEGFPGNTALWIRERDKIYDQIMHAGWNEERQAFRQCYENSALDAANLMMPLVKFVSATDPRMLSTIDATVKSLTRDYLVYRYDPEVSQDGITGEEGTFSICSFWLTECLAKAGKTEQAHLMLQRMFSSANHLGLYAEEIGLNGEMLGNFPQAYTHLSLITAALRVNEALDKSRKGF